MATDGIRWHPTVRVEKYTPAQVAELVDFLGRNPKAADMCRLGVVPAAVSEAEGNALVNGGLDRITALVAGSGAAFTASQAVVGVGDSDLGVSVSQTALQADGANAWYQGVDEVPSLDGTGGITVVSTFGPDDANFTWNEWCWAIATSTLTAGGTLANVGTSPVMLNRRAGAALGAKASGATWVFTSKVTLS